MNRVRKYKTNRKVSFLLGFIFFVFGLLFIVVSAFSYYRSLRITKIEQLRGKVEILTSQNLQRELSAQEFVLKTVQGEIIASPGTTKMVQIPFVSYMTKNQDKYWIGYKTTLPIGELLVYEEVSREIATQLKIISVNSILLVLFTVFLYLLVRGVIRYGFAGLDTIAILCDRITKNIAQGDVSSLTISDSLQGTESEEVLSVGEAIETMMKQIDTYIQQQAIFTHGMSHEFRTHLMNIQSDLDIMKDSIQEAGVFDEIQDSLKGFKHLVDQLLLLARSDQEVKQQAMEEVSIISIIEDNISIYKQKILAKSLKVTVVNTEETEEVLAYPSLLDTLIRNLISNAVKYTPEGGTITIKKNLHSFCVDNTTLGISGDEVEHLFDLFWMGDSSRTDESSHGIGGALIKKICEVHGWKLEKTLQENNTLSIIVYI